MPVHTSGPIRRSIEVEYWVIDADGRLTEPGDLVAASPGVEREFIEPLLEIKTTPCETMSALRTELLRRLRRVLERADERNKGLVPLATPIHSGQIRDVPSERTRIQDRIVGADFDYVRHCAGTHMHFEQQSGREIDQLNTLVALDPALALVNSSPYFDGRYLSAGARSKLYRWMAYDDLPGQGRLWPYVTDSAEWTRRLEDRYEEFLTAALEVGVDRDAVESIFAPESAVWTPVQLRAEFGTVEWRSPDTALPSQVLQLAEDVADIVEHLQSASVRIEGETPRRTEDSIVLPTFDAVQQHVDAAIRDGFDSSAVQRYLSQFGFDVTAYEPTSPELAGQDPITREEARHLRLDHAQRLEEDVFQSKRINAD